MCSSLAIFGFVVWLLIMGFVLGGGAFTLRTLMIWIAASAVILQLLIVSSGAGIGALLLMAIVAGIYLLSYSGVRRRQGLTQEALRAKRAGSVLFAVVGIPLFLSLGVDATVLRNLSTAAGGETIGADEW
jgi:hypothetical protein